MCGGGERDRKGGRGGGAKGWGWGSERREVHPKHAPTCTNSWCTMPASSAALPDSVHVEFQLLPVRMGDMTPVRPASSSSPRMTFTCTPDTGRTPHTQRTQTCTQETRHSKRAHASSAGSQTWQALHTIHTQGRPTDNPHTGTHRAGPQTIHTHCKIANTLRPYLHSSVTGGESQVHAAHELLAKVQNLARAKSTRTHARTCTRPPPPPPPLTRVFVCCAFALSCMCVECARAECVCGVCVHRCAPVRVCNRVKCARA